MNPTEQNSKANMIPIIGVGASAGGLKAFKSLVGAIPERSGMAYVLVQHLDPDHDSSLVEILSRETKIPIMEAPLGAPPVPDHIYVIPSAKQLTIRNGNFFLEERTRSGPNHLIDLFLESLAGADTEFSIGGSPFRYGKRWYGGAHEIKGQRGFLHCPGTY